VQAFFSVANDVKDIVAGSVQLYLLRHGDALPAGFDDDAQRPLSLLGEGQARSAAQFIGKLNVRFDAILCSPLLRARQTAHVVQEKQGGIDLITTEHLVPSSDHRQIFSQLNQHSWEKVLLVGHEPHLSTLVSLLISGSRNARIEMKTSSLALCDVVSPIGAGKGALRWLVNPELVKILTA